MIIKTIPPTTLEYVPIFLPIIFPTIKPKYVNIKLHIENVNDDNK